MTLRRPAWSRAHARQEVASMGDSVAAAAVRLVIRLACIAAFVLSAFVAALFDLARKS